MSKQSYKKKLSSPFSPKSASRTERVPQDEFLQLVANRFKLLSEPMRLRLIHALIEEEATVSALVEKVGATQASSRTEAAGHGRYSAGRRASSRFRAQERGLAVGHRSRPGGTEVRRDTGGPRRRVEHAQESVVEYAIAGAVDC